MAHAQQFHTAFVDGEVLVFAKEELDLAYKDKRCASCSSVLSLSLSSLHRQRTRTTTRY
jgi:hypothetical protein